MSDKAKELLQKMESRNKVQERNKQRVITDQDLQDIDDIVFYKTKKTNDILFGGILPYFNQINDDHERMMQDLEDIKVLLKAMINNE
ncbi:hypothetical protein [Tenuibacillus multivorans]|uniref:Uncharacterized protein n=1 Tax=Tenuibacillus multivorans TaxID=237069 RepID=A0A1G9XSM3_9BACI|nr:hypothetical protein [Tenuibacillus multivorans]GEL75780.1 hypothetical protein TMU01_00150 [Tenuibacillus multivorans]SDM99175.1 hypothetical protein SAMN05216498_1073 [Tenuibacillus multivorans]